MHVLVADDWHFHERGFSSLLRYLKHGDKLLTHHKASKKWLSAHGNYLWRQQQLKPYLEKLKQLQDVELQVFHYHGVEVYDCCWSELMSLLLTYESWQSRSLPPSRSELFQQIIDLERETLLFNMAAAMEWIDYWRTLLKRKPDLTHVIVFSGSYIYTKTLLRLAKISRIRSFVVEHFMTGNEFYLEERDTPIANNSQLRINEKIQRLPDWTSELERAEYLSLAWKVLKSKNNKNVKVGTSSFVDLERTDRKEILLVTQVMNDFSLIETGETGIASWPVYKDIINRILKQTDYMLRIKTHPWERRRTNVKSPKTKCELERYISSFPDELQKRVLIYEDEPLECLMSNADWVILLSSQAGIDAAALGLKPIVLGSPFYGRRGFTYDLTDPAELLPLLKKGSASGQLSLEEFRSFEDFLIEAFCFQLFPIRNTGSDCFDEVFYRSKNSKELYLPMLRTAHLERSSPLRRRAGKLASHLKVYRGKTLREIKWELVYRMRRKKGGAINKN